MTYCTTDELIAATGSALNATTVLTPIITAADREIDAYLAPHNLGAGDSIGACKEASLHLSTAGIYTRMQLDGTQPESITAAEIDRAIARHRAAAFRLLDLYIADQVSTSGSNMAYVRRVDGRW
ncbi:MAG: hypothetical protein WC277_08225 [Bacilli bacterium]